MRCVRSVLYLSVAAFCALRPNGAEAKTYAFKKIADTTEGFANFIDGPTGINASGDVVFRASRNGQSGIFKGNGSGVVTVADAAGAFKGFGFAPSINDSGAVAFVAGLDTGGSGIYVENGGGGPVNQIASSGTYFEASFNSIISINSSGTVAFYGSQGGVSGIFSGAGGTLTTIANRNGPFSSFVEGPSINDAGVVVFSAFDLANRQGVYTGSGGTITTITAATSDDAPLLSFARPSINASGKVVFRAARYADVHGIYTATAGTPAAPVAEKSGSYDSFSVFSAPAINSAGDVAFLATLDSGRTGIFTGPDPITDVVVRTGMPLFGSTIQSLLFFRGLNDNGDIAFGYNLSDGRAGVAVAVVPEPAGGLAALAMLALIGVRRRRRTHHPA
jgi:MYXO-CTERM domain-containing protein